MSTRIKAFTLSEVLIVLALTTIMVSMGVRSWIGISGMIHHSSTSKDQIQQNHKQFNWALLHHINQSKNVFFLNDELFFELPSGPISYLFEDSLVVKIQDDELDTLFFDNVSIHPQNKGWMIEIENDKEYVPIYIEPISHPMDTTNLILESL